MVAPSVPDSCLMVEVPHACGGEASARGGRAHQCARAGAGRPRASPLCICTYPCHIPNPRRSVCVFRRATACTGLHGPIFFCPSHIVALLVAAAEAHRTIDSAAQAARACGSLRPGGGLVMGRAPVVYMQCPTLARVPAQHPTPSCHPPCGEPQRPPRRAVGAPGFFAPLAAAPRRLSLL